MDVSSLIDSARRDLEAAGVATPRVDAEALISHVLGLPMTHLYLEPRRAVPPEKATRIRDLVAMRAKRVPLQYILGEIDFLSLTFRVGRGVFIPRPETEVLVEALMDRAYRMADRPRRILDLATGCGVIGVSLAKYLEPEVVLLSDISSEAVEMARRNAILNRVAHLTRFVVGDGVGFMRAVAAGGTGFDLVASNPPYVATGELAGLEPEVRDHDPRSALDGGPDGLGFYERIVPLVPSILRKGGLVAFEIGMTQAASVVEIFERSGLRRLEVLNDMAGRDRVIIGGVT